MQVTVSDDVRPSRSVVHHADRSLWTRLATAAVWLGAILRLWQYFSNPSIWVDEAALARNLLDRSFAGLLTPLDYAQVAPPGFLLLTKMFVSLFGSSEFVLRIIPLAAGLASLGLFPRVARSYLSPAGTFVAIFLFATAVPLVFFASNLKQYSSDVALTLVVTMCALDALTGSMTRRRAAWVAAIGLISALFSQSAVFALTSAGVVLALDGIARPDRLLRIGVVTAWAGAVVLALGVGLSAMTPTDADYMQVFWQSSFAPHSWSDALRWLWETANGTFGTPIRQNAFDGALHYPWAIAAVVMLVLGWVAVGVRSWRSWLLLSGPVFLALAAAFAHAFPVGSRVSLFLMPLMMIAVVAGLEATGRVLHEQKGAWLALAAIPVASVAIVQERPPRRPEHLRPVMQHVSDHLQAGDAVWVYYGARGAFDYYRRRIPINADVTIGDCNRFDPRAYLHQVDVVRGRRRVWVIAAHFGAMFRFDERGLLTAYLDTIGTRRDFFEGAPEDVPASAATVALYDLSSPEKLSTASAEMFPLNGAATPQRWSCYGFMSPPASDGPAAADVRARAAALR